MSVSSSGLISLASRISPLAQHVRLIEARLPGRGTALALRLRKIQCFHEQENRLCLPRAVKEGRFREDLFYRLNVIPIVLPSLRERREDIPVLAKYFLTRFAAETKKNVTGIVTDAEARPAGYSWPGNVRELANVIERAIVLGQGADVALSDLPAQFVSNGAVYSSDDLSYRHALEAAKREIVIKALAHTNGNRAAAARVLGLHKTHLLDLIKSLGIE